LRQQRGIPLSLLVDAFLGFAHNAFENPRNVPNKKDWIKIKKNRIVDTLPVFKSSRSNLVPA
jgi:hypothetical protein